MRMLLRLSVARHRFLVLLVVGVIAVGSQVAYTHYVYEEDFTYYTTTFPCVVNRAEISHGSGYGYAHAKVRSWGELNIRVVGTTYCVKKFDRPIRHIRVKAQVHYKAAGASSWSMCYNPSYSYNQGTAYILNSGKTFTSSSWCGTGTYGTWNIGHVRNSSWYGGEIWSGTHNLP